MRIVHINSYFLTNKLHLELVKKLSELNDSIQQCVFIPLENGTKVAQKYSEKNIEFWQEPLFSTIERYIWPLKVFTIYKSLISKLKSKKVDLTHAHSLISNGVLSYLYFKKTGTPYVVTVRNTDINTFMKRSFVFRKLGLLIMRNARTVIVLSPAYKNIQIKGLFSKDHFSEIENKIQVIPNGVDDYWIKNRYLNEYKSDILHIIFVGKLRENKNILGLINACRILQSQMFSFKLHIIGDGVLKEEVINAIKPINAELYGYIDDKERLLQLYRKSNLLVVPSFKESFGLIYAEAMTQGLPIVYTRGQGFDGNFADGEVGFAIDPNSPNSIAAAIVKIKESLTKMSLNAFNSSDNFSWEKNSKALTAIYRSALL